MNILIMVILVWIVKDLTYDKFIAIFSRMDRSAPPQSFEWNIYIIFVVVKIIIVMVIVFFIYSPLLSFIMIVLLFVMFLGAIKRWNTNKNYWYTKLTTWKLWIEDSKLSEMQTGAEICSDLQVFFTIVWFMVRPKNSANFLSVCEKLLGYLIC